MCGIAGWFDKREDFREQKEVLSRMAEQLRHRGPDSGGVMTGENVCLIHRR